MSDTISGHTIYEGKEFTFFLLDYILTLVPKDEHVPGLVMYQQVRVPYLEGETTEGRKICFYNLSLSGVMIYKKLVTSISAYVIGENNLQNLEFSSFSAITFYGELVDKYFNPSAKFDHISSSVDYDKGSSVRILKPFSEVDVRYNLMGNMELMFGVDNPSLPTSFTHSLGDLHSFLRITSNQVWGLAHVLDLYRSVNRLFTFFNFRNNVPFEKITLSSLNSDGYLECVGTLYVAVEFPCANISKYNSIIHSDLHENIVQLYYHLYDFRMHLCFIPENDTALQILNHNSYMDTCAVFEKIFSVSYPNVVMKNTDPVHVEVRGKILAAIHEIVSTSTGDFQEVASNYLNAFKHMGEKTLKDRFSYCLSQNKTILEKVFPTIKLNSSMISNISSGFVKQRNAFSHGDFERVLDLSVTPYTYAVSLIYIMILRLSLVDEDMIASIVKKMFWHFKHKDINPTTESFS